MDVRLVAVGVGIGVVVGLCLSMVTARVAARRARRGAVGVESSGEFGLGAVVGGEGAHFGEGLPVRLSEGPPTVFAAGTGSHSVVRILRGSTELKEAVDRARACELFLAELATHRADRYERFPVDRAAADIATVHTLTG